MNDILKTYMERFRENRHTLRRYTAFVLALAMITTLFVNWQLHGVGISMTAQYQCGEEEHTHTADCYTKVLTCGYEEGDLENADELAAAAAATSQPTIEEEPAPLSLEPQIEFVPHEHTDDCYTEVQTLTCMEEEHVHDDDCFDPEDGSLICDKFEHTHDESCYTTEYELTCGLEEGELVEQVVEPTQTPHWQRWLWPSPWRWHRWWTPWNPSTTTIPMPATRKCSPAPCRSTTTPLPA